MRMLRTIDVVAVLLLLLFLLPAGGLAQTIPTDEVPPARNSVEEEVWKEIRAIKPIYERAVTSGDWESLRPYVSKQFSLVSVTGKLLKGLEEVKAYDQEIKELIGKGGTYNVEATYEPGLLLGDVALAGGSTQEQVITSSNTHYNFSSLWTAVLTKEDGAWKLLRLHASMDPVDNAFVREFRARAQQLTFVGGLVVGALLGFLVRSFVTSRRKV